jgi:transposase
MADRFDAAISALHQQQTPIRKIKSLLKVGQHRIHEAVSHFRDGTPICHTPGPTGIIPPEIVQFIETFMLDNAGMSTQGIRAQLLTQHGIRLGATKINEIRRFLKFEFKPPKHIQKLTDDQKQ